MGHRGRTNADEQLAAALAAGRSHRDAATAAGVSEKTVYRRLKERGFRDRVAELRGAMTAAALGKLTDGMAAAAAALNGLVADADPDVRHRAAVKVIELALKVQERAELEERLGRVERLLAGGADDADHQGEAGPGGADGGGGGDPPGPAAGGVPG